MALSHNKHGKFHQRKGPFSVRDLILASGCEYIPPKDGRHGEDTLFENVASLSEASLRDVSFFDNKRYQSALRETSAGIVIVAPPFQEDVPPHSAILLTRQPYLAWARIVKLFYPPATPKVGRHPTAYIADTARISPHAYLGPFVFIGEHAVIGEGVQIGAHSVISDNVEIARDSRIAPHVTLSHCLIGERVQILPGTRIGQEGFGFAIAQDGYEDVPQLGLVVVEEDVAIGANCTIDRGSVKDTVIGAGSRIDNLVQIGHNVHMGRACIVVSQAGVSGSTILDDHVVMAAQSGLVGHIHIGRKARIGAQCGVMSDIEAGKDVIGSPAMGFREFFRNVAYLRKLTKKDHHKTRDDEENSQR